MKKQIIKLLLILPVCFVMQGCFDLEHEEFEKMSSDNFPSSTQDLEAASVGVYHTLGKSFIMQGMDQCGLILNSLCTDEMNTGWTGNWLLLRSFLFTANNLPGLATQYKENQKGITKATRVIDAFAKSSFDESKKAKYIAEMKALRILYAYNLYNLFGPVPIVTDPSIANDVYTEYKAERPSKEDYIRFMITELEDSYAVLDTDQGKTDWGRFSQGAALTLLMKIYLNEKMWAEADNIADKIIRLNKYELLPSYKDIFSIDKEGPDNKETIFVISRITSNTSYAWTWFACVMPNDPFYKSTTIKTIWGGLKMPWEFYDLYDPQDKRLETIIRYYTSTSGATVDFRQQTHAKATGACPMKYSEDPEQKGEYQGSDFVVFRYADVLLSKAEALNELYGPTGENVELVNQVRRRSGVTEIKAADFTRDSLRDYILRERGLELYGEGHRRVDLIRHGKFIEYGAAYGAQPYHVLFPIPQEIMNENPNLKQNDGYEK